MPRPRVRSFLCFKTFSALCTCFQCFIILIYAQVSQKKTLEFFYIFVFCNLVFVFCDLVCLFCWLNWHLAQHTGNMQSVENVLKHRNDLDLEFAWVTWPGHQCLPTTCGWPLGWGMDLLVLNYILIYSYKQVLSIYVIFASPWNFYAVQWENRGPITRIMMSHVSHVTWISRKLCY